MKPAFYRILAVILASLTLLGAWCLYQGDFRTLRTEEQKIRAIVDYASADPGAPSSLRSVLHPVLQFDETVQGRRVLVFTDSEIDGLMGEVLFRRGILGGWQPLSAHYSVGPVIQSASWNSGAVRIVYAVDCPPEIAHYKIQANLHNDATLMAEGDVTEPKFFHVYETGRDFFPSLYLYDAAGNQLDEREYLSTRDNSSGPSIGSAEVDMVYVFCLLLLAVGWLAVKYCWTHAPDPKNRKETA